MTYELVIQPTIEQITRSLKGNELKAVDFLDWCLGNKSSEDVDYIRELKEFDKFVSGLFQTMFDPFTFSTKIDRSGLHRGSLYYTINAVFLDKDFNKETFDDALFDFKIAIDCNKIIVNNITFPKRR